MFISHYHHLVGDFSERIDWEKRALFDKNSRFKARVFFAKFSLRNYYSKKRVFSLDKNIHCAEISLQRRGKSVQTLCAQVFGIFTLYKSQS